MQCEVVGGEFVPNIKAAGFDYFQSMSFPALQKKKIPGNRSRCALRLAAGPTTNMIANMGKEGKNISMDTLVRICETLDCGILDVIELADDEFSDMAKEKRMDGLKKP